MPILIKRYPNRKLYDTASKRYIALDGVRQLIRQGNEVQIIDNVTGEDLTTVVLSQVILENERRQTGFLPHTLLSSLIQTGGSVRRELLSSLESLVQFDDELKRRFDTLVEAGELTLEQAERLLNKLLAVGQRKLDLSSPVEKAVQAVLGRRGLASRSEIEDLSRQLEELSSKLDALSKSDPAGDDAE